MLIIYSSLKNIQYIIYDSKQIGKEYEVFHVFHNVLIYEGEYLNGERNGKGKECWLGSVIFEGEYYKGKKDMEKENNIEVIIHYNSKQYI